MCASGILLCTPRWKILPAEQREGIKNFEAKYHDYLQGQIGNPDGPEKPNKKYYDPREALRAAEVNTVKRLEQSFADLKCQNILGLGEVSTASNVLGPRRGGLPV